MANKKPLPKISWTAPEFIYVEKNSDWYWTLWIIALAVAGISFFLNNVLFSIFIVLATFVLSLLASRKPREIPVMLNPKKVSIAGKVYKFADYSEYHIITGEYKMLLMPQKSLRPILTVPLGTNTSFKQLENFMEKSPLEENPELQEPFMQLLLERLGF